MATAATFETDALTRPEVISRIAHLRDLAVVLAGDRQRTSVDPTDQGELL
jgi:hypothetical protein